MKKNVIWATLGVAIVASLVGTHLSSNRQGQTQFEQTRLLTLSNSPLLLENVNKITIDTAKHTPLVAAELLLQQWQLPQFDGYEADTEDLSNLLQAIQDAKVVELKTSRKKNHHRLGLMAVEDENSKAKLLKFHDGQNNLALLIGNTTEDGKGQYVRFVDEPQTYLIDQVLPIPAERQDWLASDVFNLEYDQIRRVKVSPSEGEAFEIERPERIKELDKEASFPLSEQDRVELAESFEMLNIPEGKELQYGSILDGLVRNLLGLTVDDVALKDKVKGVSIHHEVQIDYKQDGRLSTQTIRLLTDNAETPSYWLSKAGSKWLIKLSEFDYQQVSKTKEDFLQDIELAQE